MIKQQYASMKEKFDKEAEERKQTQDARDTGAPNRRARTNENLNND